LCVEWHGKLHAVHGLVFLQCDGLVGRVGRLQRRILLPLVVDVEHANHLFDWLLLPGAQSQHDDFAHIILL